MQQRSMQQRPMHQRLRRPAAVPLVTIDPHTSVWSAADRLTDDWPRHWTGTRMALYGVVRVDGVAYRFMGGAEFLAQAAEQLALDVGATRTRYSFRCGPVELAVGFTTPLLPDNLELLSRPVTYVTLAAHALDARTHDVVAYLDMTGEWAVNLPHERVFWRLEHTGGLRIATFRSEHQRVLAHSGDHRRIEWGSALLAIAEGEGELVVGDIDHCRDTFARQGRLSAEQLRSPQPRKVDYNSDPVAAAMLQLPVDGGVRTVLVGYDDEWSIEYMRQRLRPWWRRDPLGRPLRHARAGHAGRAGGAGPVRTVRR